MIWHPFTIQKSEEKPLEISRALKEFLYSKEGTQYVDAVSSWWVSVHGHNHPVIVEAVKKQLDQLDHVLLAGFTHEPALQLAKKLLELTHSDFYKVYYSDNGSCAVEIALKMAYQYFQNIGNYKKQKFIKFSSSYHGDTFGAMSVSGFSDFTSVFSNILLPNVVEIISPNCYSCPVKKNRDNCSIECMYALEYYMETHQEEIACIILEPLIQGAGGFCFYKPDVLVNIKELCERYSVLLIFDEVFTGFGRTGEMFAYQYANVKPDIITTAKGLSGGVLPIAATLANKKVYSAFYSADPKKALYHGHSMTGTPPACAAAIASIQLFLEENRLEQVRALEKKFLNQLQKLQDKFPGLVKNIRSLGAVSAFEIEQGDVKYTNPVGKQIKKYCLEKNVIIRPLGNVIYMTPPYIISDDSIEQIFSALEYAIERIV